MTNSEEAAVVGDLIYRMDCELWPDLQEGFLKERYTIGAERLLRPVSGLWGFVTAAEDEALTGVLTLNECAAIYAGGYFGEIAEFYVLPHRRSAGVGTLLVDAAVKFARQRGWPFLEVSAPSLPRWRRTGDFYIRKGFKEIGPRLELML